MGTILVERTMPHDGTKKRFKLNIYNANCVGAVIYEWKQKDEETGKVHDMYQFWGFWSDLKHLKRCLGLIKDYNGNYSNLYNGSVDSDNWVKLKLNVYYKGMSKIARLFAKAGYKVEIYYKEPKNENK